MPRKYEKKTKCNIRSGRRGSRRASMRLNMVPPGFSMFSDEYDPTIDDTMLFLKAKGVDRERERFGEALGEVRDRISKIVEDYDTMLDETAYIYRDYVDELEEQASVMPGNKLRQNILQILADYKIVCHEREELINALHESLSAQKNSMLEFDKYDDDDEFDYDNIDNHLRDYTKTIGWLSNKFTDMDAKVHMLKKRDQNTKGERKKQAKQKKNMKPESNKDKPELTSSKDKLDAWKYAADEIVELLHTVRQQSEGGKEALEFELQKIMSILSQQNDEIGKQKEMLANANEANNKLKQSNDKLLIQNRSLEDKLKHKRNEVTKCKQYIEEIMKKHKEANGDIVISFEDTEDDGQEELSTVMRRRFTLTESSMKEGVVEFQLKDARRKAQELEEEKRKIEEDMTKLSGALVQKEHEISDLKTLLTVGEGTFCPKCIEMTGTPDSKDEGNSENKQDEIYIFEKKLRENESKLESAVVELARMKIKFASAGQTLTSYVDVAMQTLPAIKKEKGKNKQHIRTLSKMELEGRSSEALIDNQLTEDSSTIQLLSLQTEDESEPDETDLFPSTKSFVITEQQISDGVEEGVGGEQEQQVSYAEDEKLDGEFSHEKEDEDQDQFTDTDTRSTAARYIKLENKMIQTDCDFEEFNLLTRGKASSDVDNGIDARVRMVDNIKECIAMTDDKAGENECIDSWRAMLNQLGDDIGDLLENRCDMGGDDRSRKVYPSGPQIEQQLNSRQDFFDELRSRKDDSAQGYSDSTSKRKKSIFVRLLEGNQRKRAPSLKREQPLTTLLESTVGAHIPMERINQIDENNTSENKKSSQDSNEDKPSPHLPDKPSPHLPELERNRPLATQDMRTATNSVTSAENTPTTPKRTPNVVPTSTPTPTQIPKGISNQQLVTPSQSSMMSKQATIEKTPNQSPATATTPRSGMHAFTFPGLDIGKSEIKMQTIAFDAGGDEVVAPYSKPFRVRRKSLFGHKDVLEKFAGGVVGSEDTEIRGQNSFVDDVGSFDGDKEKYYEASTKEEWKALSPVQLRNEELNYNSKEPSVFRKDGEHVALVKHHPRPKIGRYRPSLHPFIGMSGEERQRLARVDAMRQNTYKTVVRVDHDEEGEIQVGALLDDLERSMGKNISFRKAFLSLGLMHLRGEGDDIRPDELLTMEDQVNIIAQTAMEVLRTTCDLFTQQRRQSQQLSRPSSVENVENKDIISGYGEMLPPLNSPELTRRFPFVDSIKELVTEKNEQISLPSILNNEPKPEPPVLMKKKTRRQARCEKEQRFKELFSQFGRRKPMYRPAMRQFGHHKNVMEKILGSRMSTFGNILANENRYARSYKNPPAYLRRDTMGMDEFSLTAQSIKLPPPNLRHLSIDATASIGQSLSKQAGMKKSTSIGSHGLSAGVKYVPAITKAKSDQTHNRTMVAAGPCEPSGVPLTKLQPTGLRKARNFK